LLSLADDELVAEAEADGFGFVGVSASSAVVLARVALLKRLD
jgi:hypothetical protein